MANPENQNKKNSEAKSPAKVKKRKRGLLRLIISLICIGLVCWGVWEFRSMASSFDSEESAWLRIPRGSSKAEIRDQITSVLGADFGGDVLRHWSGDTAITAGAYRVNPGTKAITLARTLNSGSQTPVKLTFNNIRTLRQLAERMAERLDMSPDDFIKAFNKVAEEQGVAPEILIGHMMPDTYEVYWNATPEKVISRILKSYDSFWNADRRAKADALGITPDQAIILASIAEEETSKADERGKIARLYLNRLQKGMLLQADPTVKFALGDFSIRRIGGTMLDNPSPYNTYRHAGLPPGPIRIPERATVEALLNAPAHTYIYMCAKADFSGYHLFTSNYAEHQRNAATFRRAMNARGITLPPSHIPAAN